MYRSKERLHLSRDGRIVRPGDPASVSLLVPAGGELSDEDAIKYGLAAGKSPFAPVNQDVLPLEASSPAAPVAPTPTPAVGVTNSAEGASHAFPQSLQFGGSKPPAETVQEVTPQAPQEPSPQANTAPSPAPEPQASATQAPATPAQPESDLPADFPYRDLLARQKWGKTSDLVKITKDQLLTLDQIGSNRADEILAAVEKLK